MCNDQKLYLIVETKYCILVTKASEHKMKPLYVKTCHELQICIANL